VSRIALIGNLAVDRVAGGPPRPGGGVLWGAHAAARIGADVVVVTRCAPGDRELVLTPLEALGPPVACGDAASTAGFSFHYEGDRRVMTVDAVGERWTPDDVEGWAASSLADAGWVQLAALLASDFPAETVTALARGGRRLLLDAHGLVRVRRTGPLALDAPGDLGTLADVAILKLDDAEAIALAGGVEPERLRSLGVAEVVLTLGSRGAVVVTPETVVEIPPHRTVGAVDPTGAGDSFSLVYLDARSRDATPAEAAERASSIVAGLISGP
jgi:sugar/nucleoside kinase (ribokinase family)